MKILLINNNPVVSRLTALSARKEEIDIDEIQEVTELSSDSYDIVFVDSDSLTKDVQDVIKENIKAKKTVLFYTEGDEEEKEDFDITILKPFLPSEVSAVIRTVEEESKTTNKELEEEPHFDVLAESKEPTEEELFALTDSEKESVVVKEDSKSEEKIEKLSLDLEEEKGLSLKEESFDAKLEEAFPLKVNKLDEELFEEKEEKKDSSSSDELFELDLEEEIKSPSLSEDELDKELFSEEKDEKKENKPDDEVLDFDLDSDELKIEDIEPATKILDESEIKNIKGLLNEEIDENLSLEDLMTPVPVAEVEKKAEKRESEEREKESKKEEVTDVGADVLLETVRSLPVESLRELLAGARININIKFPKK